MEWIKRFFSDPTHAGRQHRIWAGLLLTVVMLPLLVGLLACLPVPIGNPERSKIDPALSGVWIGGEDDDAIVLILEPYDKRTWLVSHIGVSFEDSESGDDEEASDDDSDGPETYLDRIKQGKGSIEAVFYYKGWLTKLKGTRFITWEPKVHVTTDEGMASGVWFVYRILLEDDGILHLNMINYEYDGLKDATKRSQAEKIIRRNIKDPELFLGDVSPSLHKLDQTDYDLITELLVEYGIWDM